MKSSVYFQLVVAFASIAFLPGGLSETSESAATVVVPTVLVSSENGTTDSTATNSTVSPAPTSAATENGTSTVTEPITTDSSPTTETAVPTSATSTVTTSTSTTTPSKPTSPATQGPIPAGGRRFDAPSFFGGIILAFGLIAIGYVGFKFYRARTENNYHSFKASTLFE